MEEMMFGYKKVLEFQSQDYILYSVYGTPAESLCGKQVAREMAILGGLPINPPIFIFCKNNQVFCKILRLTFI
jgi:hypothetical protein